VLNFVVHPQTVTPTTRCVILADTALLVFEQMGFEVVKKYNFYRSNFQPKKFEVRKNFTHNIDLKKRTYIKNNALWHPFPAMPFSRT